MANRSSRTTFQTRLLIVGRHQSGWPQAHIAAAMGISRKCVKTWLDRYAAEGEAGLQDRSSRPHSTPTRTPAVVEEQVVALRRAERRGRDWIADRLGVPARTVSRVLARHHMPHLAMLDPMTGLAHGRAEGNRDRKNGTGYDYGDPARREGRHLCRVPVPGRDLTSPPTASPASSG